MHRVTIIGAGFAGLTAIKQLPATPAAFPDRTGCRSRHTWQAAAAARNLVGEFNGTQMDAGFKVELICIVDSNEKGILVSRTEKNNFMLPASILLHWMKRVFERLYLRQDR